MSDEEWLRIRRHLRDHRHELGIATAGLYPDIDRVAGTPLLTSAGWLPASPVPLDDVVLELDPSPAPEFPERHYSATMARLAPPAVFENRLTYRLRAAVLDGPNPRLRFGLGRYFDTLDAGEALAHELAAADLAHPPRTNGTVEQSRGTRVPVVREWGELAGRVRLGSPVDPARRPVNVAISAVTIRAGDEPRILVHRRDPARVAHAGGLLQVVPVGVFQPVCSATVHDDLSLWRCLQREFAEELLGEDEATGPVDYGARPTTVALDRARRDGRIRPFCLGLGVDPLTLATDLLCAVVVEPEVFDDVFACLVSENAEGAVSWHRFGPEIDGPMQAAGAATIALAWRHRDRLLSAE